MVTASMEVRELGIVQVRIFEDARYLETLFEDGTKVGAAPQDTDDYRATAERLGYGADTWSMCREHEIAHTFVTQALGLPYSPTLWAVAHGHHNGEMWAEEELVLAYQRWRNSRAARA